MSENSVNSVNSVNFVKNALSLLSLLKIDSPRAPGFPRPDSAFQYFSFSAFQKPGLGRNRLRCSSFQVSAFSPSPLLLAHGRFQIQIGQTKGALARWVN